MRISKHEIQAVMKVLFTDPVCLSGFFKNPAGGEYIQKFEKELAEFHDTNHAVTVSNGTTALHLALLACGVVPGDEVITTPLTFSATATTILMCGAKPVFVDVDPETYNMDPEAMEAAMSPQTRAVLPVHMLGTPCDMEYIMQIIEDYPYVKVIEDNAQALGAYRDQHITGTWGDVSTLSFQETKVITTAGEGGAIITDDLLIADKCRLMRSHGQQYGHAEYLCYNYRMTELQAAFGSAQLDRLPMFNDLHRNNAKSLFKYLPEGINPPVVPKNTVPTNYILGCLAEADFPRERFVKDLIDHGVNMGRPGSTVSLGYTKTIMDLPLFVEYKTDCPVAEDLVKHFIWFDCHRFKTESQMMDVIDRIEETWRVLDV